MNNYFMVIFAILFSSIVFAQNKKDTIYISFDDQYEEMRKVDFTHQMQAGSLDEKLKKSIDYYIEQMEPPNGYDYEFNFTHANRSKKAYKKFGLQPPIILKKPKLFMRDKKVLNINFFRSTPYIKIAKTFEEEDSWEEDVMIFMMDVDEMKNDSIILRQVDFSRPVKQ